MSLTRAACTIGCTATLFVPSLLVGQASTQQAIPIRQLGATEARSRDTVNALFGVRELSDGRLVVNDAGARRLLLFDASLATAKVLADTAGTTSMGYGARGTSIVRFAGDSTLFVDVYSRALLVIAPNGTVARTIAAPRANDVSLMANQSYGMPGIDPKGRLVYRAYRKAKERPDITVITTLQLDSAPIVRADFDTRSADTIALLGVPTQRIAGAPVNGRTLFQFVVNPLPLIDDWAMLPDGAVALLRGQDYHLDWVNADGSQVSTPKMPFDWKRLSDVDKQAIVDSAKRAVEKATIASHANTPGANGSGATASAGVTSFGGGSTGGGGPGGAGMPPTTFPPPDVVKPSELPDYIPPVLQPGTMRADPEGRLWILPSTSSQSGGGLLYDVVNRKGEIVERVRIPAGRVLAGFGARGVVYLTARDATGNWLERARLVTAGPRPLP